MPFILPRICLYGGPHNLIYFFFVSQLGYFGVNLYLYFMIGLAI